jgi:hypothetical protein
MSKAVGGRCSADVSGANRAKLQLNRLAPVMQLAAEAIAAGDVAAITAYLNVLGRLDRYQTVAVGHSTGGLRAFPLWGGADLETALVDPGPGAAGVRSRPVCPSARSSARSKAIAAPTVASEKHGQRQPIENGRIRVHERNRVEGMSQQRGATDWRKRLARKDWPTRVLSLYNQLISMTS